MELKIYNRSGELKLTVSTSSSSTWNQELMKEYSVSVSFTHPSYVMLDVEDYVLLEGVKFSIKKEYKPRQKDTQTYSYSVKFYAPIHDAEQVKYLHLTDGAYNPQFSLDGGPREHLQKWVENMNRIYGREVWSIGDVVVADNRTIEYNNVTCWDAATMIAEAFGTEWWTDGFTFNLSRCEHGEPVELGYMRGLTSLAQSENSDSVKFFTRLIPLGSTKNIDPSRYGFSRLQLPDRSKYVDRNTNYGLYEHVEEDAFAGIFPHYTGTVTAVRSEEKAGDDGNKFTVYYFKDSGMQFDPNGNEIAGLVKHVSFQTGNLAGRDFEANYDSKTGEWEIINTYPDDKTQIPGGSLIPAVGNEYIAWNFRMPVEYETQAELDYKAAVDDYLARYSEDVSKYGGDTDYIYIDRNRIPLLPGQRVRLLSDKYFSASGGTRDTRMTKVVRKLDNLSIATIECTDQVGKGWKSRVDSSLTDLKYILDKQREQLSLDILKSWDGRPATDYMVMSALRVLKEIAQKALSKTGNDRTEYSLEVGGSLTVDDILHAAKAVKFGEFLTGISGGYIDKDGKMEMEEGIFRKRVFVPEIAYNRVTYFKGRMCASPGGGCTVKEWTDNGDGSYTITPDLTDADGLSQFVDDILTTYFVTKNAEDKLQGFEEMKFRVTSADYTAKTFVMTPKPGTDWKPGESMVLAQTGNFTDEDRQTYILIDTVGGNNCITFFDHANTWDVEPAQEIAWIGKKKGRTVHGIPADNYSAVFRHVIMSGKIFQVDDITGEAFRVPLFKGTWKKGEKYAYYDEVTHNGSSWICVNEKGTSTEPADGNADWLKYAAKGESGKGIKSTDVEYAISVSNVIAPVDGWQTTSPEWEAGKYIWSRTKIVYSDGEVKYTQAACISGGQGADGKGIKSITEEYYLSSSSATTTGGEWQTDSPAWKNGWYIWTRTRIVFTDDTSTTTNAICVTGSKGADGTSITNCGEWETGKHIPYMGITRMAGRVFLCIAPDGTDNPPMWTQTTNEGRRILQTQDGGKNYGYIITGDLNTAEYELLVENGQDGKDGKGYEWIFKHTTENVTPPTPATSQVDDYVPSGWHDDPIGVSESLPYEWACCRTKKDGVWSAFSPAAIWAKWGFDGESAIVADFDNEMESIALTYEGKTVAQSVLKTTVGMWYGTKKLQLKSISCVTPAGVTESYNVNTGVIAFTVASGISMPARSEVRITVTATVQDTDISRELVFTVTGVRAGNPGSDAVLYRLVPSVSSVSKRKDGTYSVAGVSCTRTKSVGGSTSITTDGVLKYSKDGGAEVEIQNGTSISPKNFTTQLQFVYYVGGQVVDRETIPMVVDGNDGNPGKPGGDGESVKAGGEWRTANTPFKKLTICTMGGRSWLSKVDTSNPPLWTVNDSQDRRILQTQNGGKSYGYIPTGEVNTAEWEQLTQDGGMVYLISTCSNIRVSSAGSLVPSAFRVYAKRTLGSATLTYPDGYLAARGYSNGIWSAIAGPSRASEITVNASAGYSTFSVRCYQSQADASAWNDSFIAEMSVGVSYDGSSGRDASEPRPRGFFAKGNTYVWNEDYHDIVLATFNNRTIPFRVRAYGTSVTVAPTSIDGDANWEAAQQFMFVAMDMALIRKIRADEILVDDLVVQNVLARDKNGNVTCNIDGETGEVNVQGKITATAAFIKIHGFSSNEGYFYLNPNFGSDFGNGRPSRIGQSEYMLPSSAQCVGMKISLIIYNNSSGSTYGYVSVVTSDGFNDMELVDGQYHYCNKAHITDPGVYEFISLGGVWISTNKNGISYSYADLGDHDYENPVN
ncbi:hypothetical protein [Bacteroides uniformis]|uniref:hypothetical protein n=1 Tax=Bacteroides uniformis TaxID=820 RepID=UPI00216B5784|nr:hypothetical protein [Bacteroides uniformis]